MVLLCKHTIWTNATDFLCLLFQSLSTRSFSMNKETWTSTGDCKFNFLSDERFFPLCQRSALRNRAREREWIWFQGYSTKCSKCNDLAPIPKVQYFFSQSDTTFFRKFFPHLQTKHTIYFHFILLTDPIWWNGILPLFETCFFPLVLFVMYILAGFM